MLVKLASHYTFKDAGPIINKQPYCDFRRTSKTVISYQNGIYLPLEIPRTLVWHQCSNGVHFCKVIVVNEKGLL